MARTYNQDCVLAYALDLLGGRWTLLIVRELFLGPLRFGDLHAALPGIGTNLLSTRLKELQEAGLIEAAGAGDRNYRLSTTGERLRPAMREIMKWSIKYFLERPEPSKPKDCILSNDLEPDSVALALEIYGAAFAKPHADYVLRLSLDDKLYTYYFVDGDLIARRGDDAPAAAAVATDVAAMLGALRGERSVADVEIDGDEKVAAHFLAAIAH
ncbi:MAG: winged helix-turn-helix transcriptional regulator [Parvularculaceae bacterium]